jgi:anti-sigma B factor antagonist
LLKHENGVDNTEINVVISRDGAAVSLRGRIDIDSSPAVRDRLLALLSGPHPDVITTDLSAVTQIDSSGVATLIEALRVARGHKTEMRLQGIEDRLLRLFEMTGILALFNGTDSGTDKSRLKAV